MPFGIRDRISSITKKYKEKQAARHMEKEKLDAIYEEAKAKHLKTEVGKRAKEAAKETSKRRYPASSSSPLMKRMTSGLRAIGQVAKQVDPNMNPFAEKEKMKSKRDRSRNHSPMDNTTPISEDPFEAEGKMWMGDMDYGDRNRPRGRSRNRSPMDNTTPISEDPFEAEGKRWLDGM